MTAPDSASAATVRHCGEDGKDNDAVNAKANSRNHCQVRATKFSGAVWQVRILSITVLKQCTSRQCIGYRNAGKLSFLPKFEFF